MERFRTILHDEIANPTVGRSGAGGGRIDHDYELAQIITAFRNLITPPGAQGQLNPKPEDVAHLRAMLEQESLPEAKAVFQVVLAYCGESAQSESVAKIIQSHAGPYVRRVAIEALWYVDYVTALPVLLESLSDSSESMRKDHKKGGVKRDFPVRSAAAFTLRKIGIAVEEDEECQYRPDKESAVLLLQKALDGAPDETASRLLGAMSRIGGEHAERSLREYVERNESKSSKSNLVLRAKELLSSTGGRGGAGPKNKL